MVAGADVAGFSNTIVGAGPDDSVLPQASADKANMHPTKSKARLLENGRKEGLGKFIVRIIG
jgi:hypothetical protein